MTPNKPLNFNLNVYFSLCVWGKVFCLHPPPQTKIPQSQSRIFLSVCLSRCHGLPRFIFGIPWATKVRCQRSSCRVLSTQSDSYISIGSVLVVPLGAPPTPNLRSSYRTHATQPTLIRQNIETMTCGVALSLSRSRSHSVFKRSVWNMLRILDIV